MKPDSSSPVFSSIFIHLRRDIFCLKASTRSQHQKYHESHGFRPTQWVPCWVPSFRNKNAVRRCFLTYELTRKMAALFGIDPWNPYEDIMSIGIYRAANVLCNEPVMFAYWSQSSRLCLSLQVPSTTVSWS